MQQPGPKDSIEIGFIVMSRLDSSSLKSVVYGFWIEVIEMVRTFDHSVCDTRKGMYKRIVLKLSGEALAGERGFGLDADKVAEITGEIVDVHALGVEIGVVVGGGNFFRGVEEQAKEMDRVSADSMGMLSTVINAIALQDSLNSAACSAG
jgi:hypothetical protein